MIAIIEREKMEVLSCLMRTTHGCEGTRLQKRAQTQARASQLQIIIMLRLWLISEYLARDYIPRCNSNTDQTFPPPSKRPLDLT